MTISVLDQFPTVYPGEAVQSQATFNPDSVT